MRFLDKDFNLLNEVDVYVSSLWHIEYYGVGAFELRIEKELYNDKIKYMYNPEIKELGIIHTVEITDYLIKLSGTLLLDDLNRYIIKVTKNYNNKTPEYIAKDLVASFYKEEILIDADKGLGSTIATLQITGEPLGEYIIEMLREQELSCRIEFDYLTKKKKFIVYQGEDNTIKKQPLSIDFETIIGYEHLLDTSQLKNIAVVAGEVATDGSRKIIEVDVRKDTNELKRELWVDARDLRSKDLTVSQYEEALKQRGLEKLKKYIIDELIDMTPSTHLPLGGEVELGEIRLFKDTSVLTTQRITSLIYGYENGVVKKSVMFGNQNLFKKEVTR